MDCANCELKKTRFYCENCLKSHLREYTSAVGHVSSEKNVQISKAQKALEVIGPARIQRAETAWLSESVDLVQDELIRLRESNERLKERIVQLRFRLASRNENLTRAKGLGPDQEGLRASIESFHRSALDMSLSLARARAGLIQELVEVFDIVEVGGRPSLGGIPGVKGEWNIVGSVLPVPGDIRRYPPEQINATIQHTLHFVSLLTYYLGVKLPFEVIWSGGTSSIGQPFISAGKGAEHGGWAKWVDLYPLHITGAGGSSEKEKEREKQVQSFTTGFAMLLYNVVYLAHTQGVDVALSLSGEALRNLWAVCCSPELGRRSHASSNSRLPFPTPPSFSLDFTQLLQAITANPPTRARHSRLKRDKKFIGNPIIEEDGDWDLV